MRSRSQAPRTPSDSLEAGHPASSVKEGSRHLAARLDDAWLRLQTRLAIRRGHVVTVVPHTGYGTTSWVRVLARVVRSDPRDIGDSGKGSKRPLPEGMRGWRNFTSAPVAHAAVRITVGGEVHDVEADRGGVVDARIPASLAAGWHNVSLQSGESDVVEAPVQIVPDDADFGLISDIDDTVMVTALPRPFLAAWNTFVLNEHARTPTPGMAVLYERIVRSAPKAPVLYLSTGAWNVAPTLSRFLSRNLYPAGPKLLTDWGPTTDRWFRSGKEHKKGSLERLAEEFPNVKWLLVGDDGQHDVAIYTEFAQRHPENVCAIAIRQLSVGEAVLAGGRSSDAGPTPGVPWIYAPDGAGMSAQLEELGIIASSPRPTELPGEDVPGGAG